MCDHAKVEAAACNRLPGTELFCFCFGATSSDAQGLLHSQHSHITPGGSQGTLLSALWGSKQGKLLPHLAPEQKFNNQQSTRFPHLALHGLIKFQKDKLGTAGDVTEQ